MYARRGAGKDTDTHTHTHTHDVLEADSRSRISSANTDRTSHPVLIVSAESLRSEHNTSANYKLPADSY
jgi:hypothetical protein